MAHVWIWNFSYKWQAFVWPILALAQKFFCNAKFSQVCRIESSELWRARKDISPRARSFACCHNIWVALIPWGCPWWNNSLGFLKHHGPKEDYVDTLQQEVVTKLIPKTFFCVTDMRFRTIRITKQFCMWFSESNTNTCSIVFGKLIPEKINRKCTFFRNRTPKIIFYVNSISGLSVICMVIICVVVLVQIVNWQRQ